MAAPLTQSSRVLEPSLSLDDARSFLELLARKGDATLGFSWDTLVAAISQFMMRARYERYRLYRRRMFGEPVPGGWGFLLECGEHTSERSGRLR